MPTPHVLVNALSVSHEGGGGRSYLTNVLREWARDPRGFRYSVLAQPGQLDGIDTGGVELEPVHLPRWGPRVVWRVAHEELVMPLRARRFDLLFCIADLSPPIAWTPTVVLMRNLNIYDRRWYDDTRLRTLERLARLGLPRARRLVFPSRAAADLIGGFVPLPADRVRVVPYGISPEAFAAASGPETANAEVRYLFLPAAPERHKNVSVLIECLQHVKDPELQVWVAGTSVLDPGHQHELEALAAERGVAERVRFLGAVPYRDILHYYRNAVAFVFPSFIETFGHPLLEAMLSGTPIVASDIPAFREIAGDAALFFPPTDAEALARAVDRVVGEPAEARRRVERGRERVAEFTWKRSVDRLCAVFEEALRAR